ncbi:hypothetical protein LOK49_LG14G00745 [Camellia lanceoleosa]|uniref:Uncharacterized protein n=1 Tax=Camellia lanceoleosa TaxID=1840588 RepID=A0ACC0FC21_9ERIC|nr:hypothetical protein LOK49_LG14G00745 [Camellia lanceoleosa]
MVFRYPIAKQDEESRVLFFEECLMAEKIRSLNLDIAPGPIVSLGSSQPLVYNIRNSTDASGFSWNDKRSRQGNELSILTRSCLSFLSGDSGAPGYGSK